MQITYPCLLPLFVTRLESFQAFFFLVPPLAFPFPLCASRVSKDFPVLSLWFSMGVGGMTVRVSLFLLQLSYWPPHFFPLYHCVWFLLSLIAGRRTITFQFASVSRRCFSTTLLRGWLSQSNIVLLHLIPFGRGFCVLMNLGVASGRFCCSLFSFCSV